MRVFRTFVAAALLGGVFSGGCATPLDVHDAKSDIIKDAHTNRELLSAEHIKMLTGDVTGLKAQIEDARQADDRLTKALDAERERIATQQSAIQRVAGLADSFLGGFANGQGPLSAAISAVQSTATSSAAKRSQELIDAEAAKRELATGKLDEAIKVSEQRARDRAAEIEKVIQQLSKETLSKIGELSDDTRDQLKRAGEKGPEELRTAFLAEFAKVGVSKADLDNVKSISPEALYALLALVLGGGAAGGGVLSKFGKSRNSGELEELTKQVQSLNVATGRDGQAEKPYIDELFDKVSSLTARVEELSKRMDSCPHGKAATSSGCRTSESKG